MTSKEIGISQVIPLGKLGTRREIALKEYELAQEKYHLERAETLHAFRMNIYGLSCVRSSIRIIGEIQKQLALVVDSEMTANKAGMGSLANIIKANIEFRASHG